VIYGVCVCVCVCQLQTLYKFIEQKGSLQDLLPLLNSLTKQKSSAVAQMAKQGLKDLEEVLHLLNKLAVKLQVCVCVYYLTLFIFWTSFLFISCPFITLTV